MPAHGHAMGGGLQGRLPTAGVLLAAVVAYLLLARRARRRNPALGCRRWQMAAFLPGAVLLQPVAPFAHEDVRGTWSSTC